MHAPGDRRICADIVDGSIRYASHSVRIDDRQRERPHITNHVNRQRDVQQLRFTKFQLRGPELYGFDRVADWFIGQLDGSEQHQQRIGSEQQFEFEVEIQIEEEPQRQLVYQHG